MIRLGIASLLLVLLMSSAGNAVECPGCPDVLYAGSPVSLFYSSEHPESVRVFRVLEAVEAMLPGFSLTAQDVSSGSGAQSWQVMVLVYGTDGELALPAALISGSMVAGTESLLAAVREVAEDAAVPAEGFFPRIGAAARWFRVRMMLGLDSFMFGAVAAAGLVDGVNPCSLSILLFLAAYLAYAGRDKGRILLLGSAFIGGVLVVYLGIGLGLLAALNAPWFAGAYRFLYPLFGLITLVLGCLSLIDASRLRRGETRRVILQLPDGLKRRAHAQIRRWSDRSSTVLGAGFVTGMAVTVFEFPCTGQLYLPTLTLIGDPLSSTQSLTYLLVYNAMFIVPELVVVATSALLSAKAVAQSYQRLLSGVKTATALVFFGLAAYYLTLTASYF